MYVQSAMQNSGYNLSMWRRNNCTHHNFFITSCHLWIYVLLLFSLDKPRVLAVPAQLYLGSGMAGRIECPTDANPPAYQVMWRKDEQVLSESDRVKVSEMHYW